MVNKKSDIRKFLETMWIMSKDGVVLVTLGAGLAAAIILFAQNAKSQTVQKAIDTEKIQSR